MSAAQSFTREPTKRELLRRSLATALRSGALAPAVVAGLLLDSVDGVASHALDAAEQLDRDHNTPATAAVVRALYDVVIEDREGGT